MMRVSRWIRRKLVYLFDLPIDAYLTAPHQQQMRDTGFGISAPNAYRFSDVLRHDWAMVVSFFSIIALLSRILSKKEQVIAILGRISTLETLRESGTE